MTPIRLIRVCRAPSICYSLHSLSTYECGSPRFHKYTDPGSPGSLHSAAAHAGLKLPSCRSTRPDNPRPPENHTAENPASRPPRPQNPCASEPPALLSPYQGPFVRECRPPRRHNPHPYRLLFRCSTLTRCSRTPRRQPGRAVPSVMILRPVRSGRGCARKTPYPLSGHPSTHSLQITLPGPELFKSHE